MRFFVRRRWLAVAILCLGPTFAVTAASEWASETAKDILAYPAAEKQLREMAKEREECQIEINRILIRCAMKDAILDELESGKITLLVAAQRFQELDRSNRVLVAIYYQPQCAGSFDEIAALSTIRHLRSRESSGRMMFAGTMDRVSREFETAYGYRPEE